MYQGNPNRPDLEPDDMPRNKFELFTTTLGVRFGDLFKLNLLFVLFILPLLIWTVFSFYAFNTSLASFFPEGITAADVAGEGVPAADSTAQTEPAETAAPQDAATGDQALQDAFWSWLLTYALGLVPCLMLAGPPIAGLTYVARNWARDEHAWLWSDFKEHSLKNWKQAVASMLILGLAIVASIIVFRAYGMLIGSTGSTMIFFMRTIFVILAALYFMSYMYIFPLMVTYNLRMGQLIRNSFALALGRLPFTILFSVLSLIPLVLGVMLATFVTTWALPVMVLYYALFGFSLMAFINNSYTNATFERFMNAEKKAEEERNRDKAKIE